VLALRVVLVWLGTVLGLVVGCWETFLAVSPTHHMGVPDRLMAGLIGGVLLYVLGGGVFRTLRRARTHRS